MSPVEYAGFLEGRIVKTNIKLINLDLLINVKTPTKNFLSAAEATSFLGVRRQTLYSYVSRGLVRSLGDEGSRERIYAREDLERLRQRAQARKGQGAVAAVALNLGHPLVPTRITELTDKGPSYRGRMAVDLARQGARFEQVAELLWTGLWHEDPFVWNPSPLAAPLREMLNAQAPREARDQLPEVFAITVLQLGMGKGPIQDRLIRGRPLEAAREVVHTLVGCLGFLSRSGCYVPAPPGTPVAVAALNALGRPRHDDDAALLDAMLVLLADHELSPGTFAARIAASSGSAVHACLAAALAASSGTEVARRYQRVEEFLDAAGERVQMQRQVRSMTGNGQAIPGFDHPLYPAGDPRAMWLFELIQRRRSLPSPAQNVLALVSHVRERHALHPRHELAVIAACRALRLPRGAATALFLVARTAGWMAHVLEQRLSPTLIRPRARFIHPREAGSANTPA